MPPVVLDCFENDDDMGDGGKDPNKSSGLKRIAKQVIDIIQTRPFMSYPQVAYLVV